MFKSTILDLATGLVFTFLAVSIAASAVTETIASMIKWRSKTLKQGIKDLLNDNTNNLSGLALQIYNHALVNPRANGAATEALPPPNKTLPAYIDPKHFAEALMDVTGMTGKAGQDAIMLEVNKLTDPQLKRLLTGIVTRTGGNLTAISDGIAHWFDNGMDRVSGAYKRWSQLVAFLVALVLVITLNLSAVHVGQRMWKQPIDIAAFMQIKAEDIKNNQAAAEILKQFDQMAGLAPSIGWQDLTSFQNFWTQDLWSSENFKDRAGSVAFDAWSRLAGWAITAMATLFGAAFWFDGLQQIIRLKGAGPSPAEKAQDKGAAA